jgi:hypothetical protein
MFKFKFSLWNIIIFLSFYLIVVDEINCQTLEQVISKIDSLNKEKLEIEKIINKYRAINDRLLNELLNLNQIKLQMELKTKLDKGIETTTGIGGTLRDQPSISGTEIIRIPSNSKIIVYNWYQEPYFKVSFKEKIGYLSYSSINLTDPLKTIVGKTQTKKAVTRTSSNPVSSISRYKAKSDLKASLLKDYGNNYTTIEMLLNAGMEAYDKLTKIPNTNVNNGILKDLVKDYYPNFSTIQMLFEANKKSYKKLR